MSERAERGGGGGGLSYRDAGVDRAAAERTKRGIGALIESTRVAGVLSQPGGFGGLFRVPGDYDAPVLVASADGVGTKLKVAMRAGVHDTVGRDLVNHCVNDILVEGAAPLFFLDYVGMGVLEPGIVEDLVAGVAAGCRDNGCALLGGETAEMPDFYDPGEYDLAGFIVGVVEEDGRPSASRVREGDALIGLASDGFHTNGYSLLRKLLFERMGLDIGDRFPDVEASVGEVLLRVHRPYARPLLPLIRDGRVAALAHITGGGIPGNLDRSIPDGLTAVVGTDSWAVPPEFEAVARHGRIEREEMFRTLNMGVGMIAVCRDADADDVVRELGAAGETAWRLGHVECRGTDALPVRLHP